MDGSGCLSGHTLLFPGAATCSHTVTHLDLFSIQSLGPGPTPPSPLEASPTLRTEPKPSLHHRVVLPLCFWALNSVHLVVLHPLSQDFTGLASFTSAAQVATPLSKGQKDGGGERLISPKEPKPTAEKSECC